MQMIIFVNDEKKVALRVFKRVKHLWVLKFYKKNAFTVALAKSLVVAMPVEKDIFVLRISLRNG